MNKKPFRNSKNQPAPQNSPSTSNESFFVKPNTTEKIVKKTHEKFPKKPQQFVQKKSQKTDASLNEKKPFNKKQWRLKKYSKKYKLDEWESKRKKFMEHRYKRELKKQPAVATNVQKIYEEEDDGGIDGEEETQQTETTNVKETKRRRLNYAERMEKLKRDKEEALKRSEERKAQIEEAKKKKIEKNRILSRKTRKGQPIMKGRLELLLKQIQEKCAGD